MTLARRSSAILIWLSLTACGDAADLCDRAEECGWLTEPRASGTSWPKLGRLDTCRKLINDVMDDAEDCVACNKKRPCSEGPCQCLQNTLKIAFEKPPAHRK